jgi:hypothetical protein
MTYFEILRSYPPIHLAQDDRRHPFFNFQFSIFNFGMRIRFKVLVPFLLFPLSLRADALTDLRTALAGLGATTPVHGSIEATSTSHSSEEEKAEPGKASVGFEISDVGLKILYPRGTLEQAEQEARGEAVDPERMTPVRNGLSQIKALHLAEILDQAAALTVTLQNAQLVEVKPATWRGRPARLMVLRITPRLSKSTAKHMKKLETSLSLWLGEDHVPMAAERTTHVKASFLLMTFESDQKQSWTFTRIGDRLLATRYDESDKSDGLGQHGQRQSSEVVTVD